MQRFSSRRFVRELVINVPVMGLVRAYFDDDVTQASVSSELPVVDRDRGRLCVGLGAFVNARQLLRVAGDRFPLEVAHDAMSDLGGDQIKQKGKIIKDSLRQQNQKPLYR
jgi:hypothetical protein